jgi:hypothetical protein
LQRATLAKGYTFAAMELPTLYTLRQRVKLLQQKRGAAARLSRLSGIPHARICAFASGRGLTYDTARALILGLRRVNDEEGA